MKFVLLAAAAVLAAPAIAQTTPAPTPDQSTTMPADQSTTTTGTAPTTTTADPMATDSATAPTNQSMNQPMPMQTAPSTSMGTENAGGYQPSNPAVSGGTPGMAPTFRAAPSPSEAFPPPAPMADYPMCKKGQFDHCKQGPASTHSREVRGRR